MLKAKDFLVLVTSEEMESSQSTVFCGVSTGSFHSVYWEAGQGTGIGISVQLSMPSCQHASNILCVQKSGGKLHP